MTLSSQRCCEGQCTAESMAWTAPGDELYWYNQDFGAQTHPLPLIQQGSWSPAALITPKADAEVVHS